MTPLYSTVYLIFNKIKLFFTTSPVLLTRKGSSSSSVMNPDNLMPYKKNCRPVKHYKFNLIF